MPNYEISYTDILLIPLLTNPDIKVCLQGSLGQLALQKKSIAVSYNSELIKWQGHLYGRVCKTFWKTLKTEASWNYWNTNIKKWNTVESISTKFRFSK